MTEYTSNITVYDPWANLAHVQHEYGLEVTNELPNEKYDAVILAVAHKEFLDMDVNNLTKENGVVYDVKGILPRDIVDGRL